MPKRFLRMSRRMAAHYAITGHNRQQPDSVDSAPRWHAMLAQLDKVAELLQSDQFTVSKEEAGFSPWE